MKTKMIAALLMGIMLITTASIAQTRTDKRERVQRVRIHEGRKDGEVTNREASLLNREQRHIHRTECLAKADGHVSRKERARLVHQQNRASRHIHRAKNNTIVKN